MKIINTVVLFLLMKVSVYGQNFNGTYKDNSSGFTLKISNYNVVKGSLTFELIVNEHPCFGSRKEIANCCEYDNSPANQFMFQTGQDIGDTFLYLTFKNDGDILVKSDENGFYIAGMCGIFVDEFVFNKIITPKKITKKKK
jgi:hypothetical protein